MWRYITKYMYIFGGFQSNTWKLMAKTIWIKVEQSNTTHNSILSFWNPLQSHLLIWSSTIHFTWIRWTFGTNGRQSQRLINSQWMIIDLNNGVKPFFWLSHEIDGLDSNLHHLRGTSKELVVGGIVHGTRIQGSWFTCIWDGFRLCIHGSYPWVVL